MNIGIVYVSYGRHEARDVLMSIRSLRKLNDDFSRLPVISYQIDRSYFDCELNSLSCPIFKSTLNVSNDTHDVIRAKLVGRATCMCINPFDKFLLLDPNMRFTGSAMFLFENKYEGIVSTKASLISEVVSARLRGALNDNDINFDDSLILPNRSAIVITNRINYSIGSYLIHTYSKIIKDRFYNSMLLESILLAIGCKSLGYQMSFVKQMNVG